MNRIHVAIPVYNRVKALKRLLKSLGHTIQPAEIAIDLHFYLDYSQEQNQLQSVIDHFEWALGVKYISRHKDHVGLDHNLLTCGQLALECGHVVVLEDDSFVAPNIWKFCNKILKCQYTQKIGGFGLYNYIRTDNQWPFYPLSESYFLQKVCTRGQIFTWDQWQDFEKWLRAKYPILGEVSLHYLSHKAGKTWEKIFNDFLVDTDRHFIHWGMTSVTTNFGVPGTNVKRKDEENAFQVPLQLNCHFPEIPDIETTTAVYDAFFELLPSRMKGLNFHLEPYDFEVDLYGTKPFAEIQKPYVLSCKKATKPEMTFGRNLKPHELNIAYEIEGQDFFLAKKENFREGVTDRWRRALRTHYYHYPDVSITKVLKMKLFEIIGRLFN